MTKLSGWFIALSVISIAAVACSSDSSAANDPASTSTDRPTATLHPDGPTPGPTVAVPGGSNISSELAEFLADIDRKMSAIRGIPVAEAVPFRFLDDDAINAYVREQINDPEVVEDIGHADAIYTLLGLIEADAVLFDQYASLLDAQVLGAYDPEVEEFVVLQPGAEFGPSQAFTYAHEYIHRLQDAQFSLDEISDRLEGNSDRSLAFTALVEGDATTAQQQYAIQHLDLTQLTQILSESQAAVEGSQDAPYILQRGLEFPYIEGASFVDRLRATQGAESVDAAFAQPPDSTEQIMHITKFVNRELPIEVTLPETLFADDGPVGEGWEIVNEDVFGEFFIKAWLEGIGARSSDAAEAALGWGGDAVTLAANGDGEHALVGKIVWDNPDEDAEQFFLVLTTIMAASPEFLRADIGPNIGIKAYESDGGVIVAGTFNSPGQGNFTAVAAANDLRDAMSLVLALAS